MKPAITDRAAFPLCLRLADADTGSDAGRTLTGVAVPYGEPSLFAGPKVETFRRGAFRKHLSERRTPVKLFRNHRYESAIGRATSLAETDDGLTGTFRIFDTPDGNAALAEIREGALDSLSVGFRPILTKPDGEGIEIVEAALGEISLVAFPAYESARVLAVRHRDEIAALFGTPPTVDLTPIILRRYDS